MNSKSRLLLLIILCLLTPPAHTVKAAADGTPVQCFDRLVQPVGWQIPAYSGTVLRHGTFTETGLPNVTFTTYAISKPFFLPHYYVEGGALMLVSLRFRSVELKRLEVSGKPFAFLAAVRGADVGTVGSVWWVDREGDGKFEEFAWNPKLTEVPVWVRSRSAAPIG